ncbi:sulfur carrier protein ThiS [Candidatus Omnitrophota bacterium]
MELKINGEDRKISGLATLEELLLDLGINKDIVAVELNKNIVKRMDYPETKLHENDSLEIVQIIGGG